MARPRYPRVIELFAGAGLLSAAFVQEKCVVTRAIELDAVAAETYRINLGNHIEVGDVTTISPEGDCDILIAGPPCQGFSTLGSRNPDDPRNALSLEVSTWARILRPKVVVIENVEAFTKSDAWKTVRRRLRRCGYEVGVFVVDAFDFGVAQYRRRSFTIASRVGIGRLIPITRQLNRTVRNAWKGLPRRPDGKKNHYSPEPSELALARMRVIPQGGDKRNVMDSAPELAPPSWKSIRGEATDVWGRMSWGKPSNTLRTCLQNPSKGRYIHPQQNRVISLREAARIHSIEDSWEFHGLPTQIARQIGNSVPSLLGRAVARMVREMVA